MKNIVQLSTTQIFPALSGGQMRSSNFALALGEAGYAVSVYCLSGRKKEYLTGKGNEVQIINPQVKQYIDRSRFNAFLQFLCYRLEIPDLWLDHFLWAWLIPRKLRQLLKTADLVVFDSPYTTPLQALISDRPRLLLSHNSEWQRWKHSVSICVSQKVLRLEHSAAQAVDLVLACADHDATAFASYGAKECLVIHNGINMSRLSSAPGAGQKLRQQLNIDADEKLLLFTASRYGPNVAALEFLQRFNMQHVSCLQDMKIKLLVVGSVAERASQTGQLIVTGPVDDIAPYFAAADGALNPIMLGSGTNVKMFEYIAMKIPILTTSFGARGFEFVDGEDGLLFEPEAFLSCLKQFADFTPPQLKAMAESSFKKNRHQIFMNEIVAERLAPRLKKLLA